MALGISGREDIRQPKKKRRCERALRSGMTLIDTAESYGGHAIASQRDRAFLGSHSSACRLPNPI
jgi:aryl-alcohol dehydrogenase-like predicted oxidoreductase